MQTTEKPALDKQLDSKTGNLSDMKFEELWELFPIALTEHKDEWTEQYEQMEIVLRANK